MHIVIHMFRSMNMLEEIKEKWDEILLNIKEEHDIVAGLCGLRYPHDPGA